VSGAPSVDEALDRYWGAIDELLMVGELAVCRRLVDAYASVEPPRQFEIVEITVDNLQPEAPVTEFLGFDLACGYHISLLSHGLDLCGPIDETWQEDELLFDLLPLIRLIEAHFQPQLNANCLFDDYQVACFCLEAMMAVQKVRPNLWEGGHCVFEVLGIWRVKSEE